MLGGQNLTTIAAAVRKAAVLQAGTAARPRMLPSKLNDIVSVKDFGAVGDGLVDDTLAMQAAHATGKFIYYPDGTYKFSTISFSDGGIIGAGRNRTILNSTDTTGADIITFTGNGYFPTFTDFQLAGAASKASGAGINVVPASGESKFASFKRVCFNQLPTCLNFAAASFWSVLDCFFQTYNIGIVVNNSANPDGGDQIIGDNCVFSTDTGIWPTSIGILYQKGGGLKIIGCKILSGQYGILMLLDGNTNTSDFQVIGNSIENQTFAGISLNRSSGTITFENVVMAGNQFAGAPNSFQAADTDTFLSNMYVGGNVFRLPAAGIGIDIDRITGFNIGPNTFVGTSTNIGVRVGVNCVDGKVCKQSYSTVATTLSNSSTSTLVDKDVQSGTSSGTTNAAYGTLFVTPAVTVNFPTAFTVTPSLGDVTANVSDGAGGGIAIMCTGVSKTQATFLCIGLNNASVINFGWSVQGVK